MTPITPTRVARAERLALVHPLAVVAELTGINRATIYRLRDRKWRPGDYRRKRRTVPSDFAIQAKDMTSGELARHYRAATRTIARWLAETKPRARMKPPGRRRR